MHAWAHTSTHHRSRELLSSLAGCSDEYVPRYPPCHAGALWNLIKDCTANRVKFAAAGAIPALVALLGPKSSDGVRNNALLTLYYLADFNYNNLVVEIVANGAIPPLVVLLGPKSSTKVQMNAVRALMQLANFGNVKCIKLLRSVGVDFALRLLIQSTTDERVRSTAEMVSSMINLIVD